MVGKVHVRSQATEVWGGLKFAKGGGGIPAWEYYGGGSIDLLLLRVQR